MADYTGVLLIFLGSFLTFLTTLSIDIIKDRRERNEKRSNFKLFVRQEFRAVKLSFEKLKATLGSRNYYDYLVLTQLDKNIASLDSYKKESIYLSSISLQEEFIDLISDLSLIITDIRALQNFYYEQSKSIDDTGSDKPSQENKGKKLQEVVYKSKKELDTFFESKKTEKSIDIIEIKRRIDDFLKKIAI